VLSCALLPMIGLKLREGATKIYLDEVTTGIPSPPGTGLVGTPPTSEDG